MDGTLVGFKRFISKKGSECCVANIVTQYTPAENERGSVGSGVSEVFLPNNQLDMLTPGDVGKKVRLYYSIVAGRAYLDSLEVMNGK